MTFRCARASTLTCRLIFLVGVKWSCLRVKKQTFPPWQQRAEAVCSPQEPPEVVIVTHGDLIDSLVEILHEEEIQLKLSGNKVYYTACSLLVILKNSCSKLHRQKGFQIIFFL